MADFATYLVGAIVLVALYLQVLRLRQIYGDLSPGPLDHIPGIRPKEKTSGGVRLFVYCFTLGPIFAMLESREVASIRRLQFRVALNTSRSPTGSPDQNGKLDRSEGEARLRRAMVIYWMRYRLPGLGILVFCAGTLFLGMANALETGSGWMAALWGTLGLALAFLLQWLLSWLYLGFGIAYFVAKLAERMDAEAPRIFVVNIIEEVLARPDLPFALAVMLGSAVVATAGDLLDLTLDLEG